MKMRKLFQVFALLFVASIIFTGCRSDDPEVLYIVVEDNDTLDQTVYADDETGESGVRITTLAPWWSAVRDVTANATAETARNAPNWVSVSPESGGAGTYTLTISLEPNTTGANRSAEISIISAETVIRINITQQGVTECGYIPQPDDPSIVRAENIIGDDTGEIVMVRAFNSDGFFLGETPFKNNGFTLQLKDVPEYYLRSFPFVYLPDYWYVSDRNVRMSDLDFIDWIIAYNSNGNRIRGSFYLASKKGWFRYFDAGINAVDAYHVFWFYADRDVTVRGTSIGEEEWSWEYTYDLNFRKGWNIAYGHFYQNPDTQTRKFTLTTQRPAGVNLRWHFESWGSWSSHSANTRGTESRRSIFKR